MVETIQKVLASQLGFSIVTMAVLLGLILTSVAACILAERKIAGFIQDRKGPNRVGPWGLLQPVADGLKFVLKEDFTPGGVEKPLYFVAPMLAFGIALLGFAIIPWAGEIHWPWMPEGETVTVQVASLDVGVLYLLAVASVGIYGVVLAGYASNNKYSFYGSMRAAAQMISYEVPLGLALMCVLLVSGTLRPEIIVNEQATQGMWNVFLHPLAFLLMLVAGFAETNRSPFDLAEAEQELVGGYHTEYSALSFAMFFLAEYAHMITGSALLVTLFLGGWHFWGLPGVENHAWWAAVIKFAVFWVKVALLMGFYMVVRWTLLRFRFDQLMRLAWKSMIPLGMALVVAAAVVTACGWQRNLAANLVANALVLIGLLLTAAWSREPITGRQPDLPEIRVKPV